MRLLALTILGPSALSGAAAAQTVPVPRPSPEAAQRAVLRCGLEGYGPPQEAMPFWQTVQITSDAAQKAVR